jgi:hypothetical protein
VTSAGTDPSCLDDLRSTFTAAGLAVPTVPAEFHEVLERRGSWCWSSEPLDTTPYLVEEFVRSFEVDPTHDRIVIAHAGHGSASWVLCYFVMIESVGVFVHSSWGSSLDTEEQDAVAKERFAARLHDATEFLDNARSRTRDSVVAVVVSDMAGDRWARWRLGERPEWQRSPNPFVAALDAMVETPDPT